MSSLIILLIDRQSMVVHPLWKAIEQKSPPVVVGETITVLVLVQQVDYECQMEMLTL